MEIPTKPILHFYKLPNDGACNHTKHIIHVQSCNGCDILGHTVMSLVNIGPKYPSTFQCYK